MNPTRSLLLGVQDSRAENEGENLGVSREIRSGGLIARLRIWGGGGKEKSTDGERLSGWVVDTCSSLWGYY